MFVDDPFVGTILDGNDVALGRKKELKKQIKI